LTPFDTGADFSFAASVPNRPGNEDEATFTKGTKRHGRQAK
jgi:hypothetical protein